MRLSTINTRRSTVAAQRPAFTLLELLVVIGIIAVLGTIIGVVATRARGGATKFQIAAQLQAIGLAIDAYRTEFSSLPPSAPTLPTGTPPAPPTPPTAPADIHINREGLRGARLLCKMLVGAAGGQAGTIGAVGSTYDLDRGNQDGKAGLGFSTPGRSGVATIADSAGNMNGKTYGPYLATDKFKIANTATDPETIGGETFAIGAVLPGATYDDRAVLLDASGQPILYFPAMNQQPPVALPFAHLSAGRANGVRDNGPAEVKGPTVTEPVYPGTPTYNGLDNAAWLPTQVLRYLLGDVDLSARYETATEKPAIRNGYILWTAGPDGKFGPRLATGGPAGVVPTIVADRVAELKEAVTANRYDDVTNLPE